MNGSERVTVSVTDKLWSTYLICHGEGRFDGKKFSKKNWTLCIFSCRMWLSIWTQYTETQLLFWFAHLWRSWYKFSAVDQGNYELVCWSYMTVEISINPGCNVSNHEIGSREPMVGGGGCACCFVWCTQSRTHMHTNPETVTPVLPKDMYAHSHSHQLRHTHRKHHHLQQQQEASENNSFSLVCVWITSHCDVSSTMEQCSSVLSSCFRCCNERWICSWLCMTCPTATLSFLESPSTAGALMLS